MTFAPYTNRTVLAPGNAGAGNAVTAVVPGSELQMLLAVTFRLTTSVAVATRTPILSVRDGSNVAIVRAVAGFGITASDVLDYSYAAGLSEWDAIDQDSGSGPVPVVPLQGGDVIRIDVNGVQAADTLTNVRIVLAQVPSRADLDD